MSLLNQVLQDLEDRSPVEHERPLRLAVAAREDGHSGKVPDEKPTARRLLLSGILVILGFIVAVWIFYPAGHSGDAEPVVVKPALATQAEVITPSAMSPQAALPGSEPGAAAASLEQAKVEPAEPAPTVLPEQGAIAKTTDEMPAATVRPRPSESALVTSSLAALSPPSALDGPVDPVATSSEESADYLVLRNTQLPPEATFPEKANAGIPSKSFSVKMAKRVVPMPLDEVRQEIELGELSYAEYLLHEHLRITPDDGEARELLLGLILRGERYDAAMLQLERGLKHEPGNTKFILIKARLLAQSGDVQGAIQALEATTGEGAGAVQRLQMLGALYQQLARYEQAEASYRALLELSPASAEAWAGLGLSMDGLGAPAAREAYLRALQLGSLPVAADAYVRQRVAELETARD